MEARAEAMVASKSLASLRLGLIQAKKRSTTQRLEKTVAAESAHGTFRTNWHHPGKSAVGCRPDLLPAHMARLSLTPTGGFHATPAVDCTMMLVRFWGRPDLTEPEVL